MNSESWSTLFDSCLEPWSAWSVCLSVWLSAIMSKVCTGCSCFFAADKVLAEVLRELRRFKCVQSGQLAFNGLSQGGPVTVSVSAEPKTRRKV